MLLVLLMYMLFGSTFTFGKMALDYVSPILFIGIRMTVGGILLLGYQYFFNRSQWRFERKHAYLFGLIAVFHIFVAYVAEFWALKYFTAAKTCLLYNLSPFITALLAYYVLKEYMTVKKWMGLFIGVVGFMPIMLTRVPMESTAGYIGVISVPEIVLVVAVVASCYGWTLFKRLMLDYQYPPIMINGIGMVGGGLLALVTSLIFEGWPTVRFSQTPYLFGLSVSPLFMIGFYTGLLILISNIICYNLYGFLLRRYSATFLSFAGFTTPLFAAVFEWILRGEVVSQYFILSVGLVSGGLYLFYQDELHSK